MFPTKVMTFNICNFDESVLKKAVDPNKLTWQARAGSIFRVLEKHSDADLICIQEASRRTLGQFSELCGKLEQLGYKTISWENNPSPKSFINMIAFKADRLALHDMKRWWNNPENPEVFGDPLGGGFGKVTVMGIFYPITKGANGSEMPDYQCDPIYVVNTHPGLKRAERDAHHKLVPEMVNKIVKKGQVYIATDGNFFDDDGGKEQVQQYINAGFTDLTAHLKTLQGLPITGTIKSFSCDKDFAGPAKMGGHFDHIFYKSINTVTNLASRYLAFVDMGKYNGSNDELVATSIKDMLIDPKSGKDLRDEFPSDHRPVIVSYLPQPEPRLVENKEKDEEKEMFEVFHV